MSLCRLRARASTLVQQPRRRLFHSTLRRREREKYDPAAIERAEDEVDVCIVGAGPAGLSAAIRLKQLEQEKGKELRVVVLEKGPEVGEWQYYLITPDCTYGGLQVLISFPERSSSQEPSTSSYQTGKTGMDTL